MPPGPVSIPRPGGRGRPARRRGGTEARAVARRGSAHHNRLTTPAGCQACWVTCASDPAAPRVRVDCSPGAGPTGSPPAPPPTAGHVARGWSGLPSASPVTPGSGASWPDGGREWGTKCHGSLLRHASRAIVTSRPLRETRDSTPNRPGPSQEANSLLRACPRRPVTTRPGEFGRKQAERGRHPGRPEDATAWRVTRTQ